MKFNITNTTKNKVVLANFEAADAESAAGKYISAMFIAGLVSHCERDVKINNDGSFRFLGKGWDFTVTAAA